MDTPGRMSSQNDEREQRAVAEFLSARTEENFCALFDALYGRLCRYFAVRGIDAPAAEELAENVMFQVYRHIS